MSNRKFFFGYPLAEASRLTGYGVPTMWYYATGKRRISAERAVVISKALGIPLHLMRPDLWPTPQGEKTEISVTSRTCEPGSGNPLSSVTRKPGAGELVED